MLIITASPRPVFANMHTMEASEATQRSSQRHLPTNIAIQKRSTVNAWLWTIRMCLHKSHVCIMHEQNNTHQEFAIVMLALYESGVGRTGNEGHWSDFQRRSHNNEQIRLCKETFYM